MLGIVRAIQDDKRAIFIELESKADFKINEQVTVSKTKKIRSIPQNNTYWLFLTWLVDPKGGDLKSQGYFSIDALHLNVKGYIQEVHPNQFKTLDKKFSTTQLSRQEFNEFLELINQELFVEILGVDTSGFWKDLEKFSRWQEYHMGGMDDFLKEKAPEVPF
jgi:hypothetical protein